MTKNQHHGKALRLASPAPGQADADDDLSAPATIDADHNLDQLCEHWVHWRRTRRYYAPPPTYINLLGQMTRTSRPLHTGGPNAPASAKMMAWHLAWMGQPDALDKRVFDLYYVHRIRPVKRAAVALAISRQHFYAVLRDFRRRLHLTDRPKIAPN